MTIDQWFTDHGFIDIQDTQDDVFKYISILYKRDDLFVRVIPLFGIPHFYSWHAGDIELWHPTHLTIIYNEQSLEELQ